MALQGRVWHCKRFYTVDQLRHTIVLEWAECHRALHLTQRLYDRSGDGKHCHETAWGCIVLAYSVIALFATRGQWRRRAGDSDETPPIDLLLLYCVRRPTVFSRFVVCQSHKPKERNKVYVL